jgi:hypothetical protein
MLLGKVQAGAALVQTVLPGLPPGSGVDLLLRIHALVVGLRQMADPPPALRDVLARDELAPLRVHFATALGDTITVLVEGMIHAQPRA